MADAIRHPLSLLLSAYGYNLYDKKNRARADDLLVRENAAGALADASGAVSQLRTAYRRRFIPPPTRENPDPPPEHLERLRQLADLQERLSGLETRVRSMPVPTQDKVWERFRREQTLLNQLLLFDYNLVGPSHDIRDQIQALVANDWNDETADQFQRKASEIERSIRGRAELLQTPIA